MAGNTLNKQKAFTLIELLVVILVVTLLLAILLPALQKTKILAKRVICASNLRQCSLVLGYYADDNESQLPFIDHVNNRGDCSPALFQALKYSPVNLAHLIDPYVGNPAVWRCPSITKAVPINDSRNTRILCYFTYNYYPGQTYPTFRDDKPHPRSFKDVKDPINTIMMQDYYMEDNNKQVVYYNHGKGRVLQSFPDINPSHGYKVGTLGKAGDGVNLLFYDGHVDWYHYRELVDIGSFSDPKYGQQNYRIFSRFNQ